MSELFRALACLAEPPAAQSAAIAAALDLPGIPTAAEYVDCFTFQRYPYASVYLNTDGMLGGEARDRIGGFFRALALAPPAEPDHIAVVLGLYAQLIDTENDVAEPARKRLVRVARKALLYEHLLSWLPPYVETFETASTFYRAWAGVLAQAVANERDELGEPDALPIHYRDVPALADPRIEGTDAFLDSLLAPIRSGFILLRDDLGRAAAALNLGLRRAERRFVLRSLFAQEPVAMLSWLTRNAAAAARRYGELSAWPGGYCAAWTQRCYASVELLESLCAQATKAEAGFRDVVHERE